MTVREEIENALKQALTQLGVPESAFTVGYPPLLASGDYATNAALSAAKALGKKPQEIAHDICIELSRVTIPYVEKIEAAGPGFINFSLSRNFFAEVIGNVLATREKWGTNVYLEGKKIMVEHTQPNPFKPFHIGHLMSNTIGESIARLMHFSGAQTLVVNYQGDIGLHIAKGVWGLWRGHLDAGRIEDLGRAYVEGNMAYENDPTAKHEIDAINTALYNNSNKEWSALREKGIKTSLAHFEELYKILGSSFEHYFFEGEVWRSGIALVQEGLQKNIFEKSDGAIVFHGDEKQGLHTRVFLTSQGLPTYEAKELGLALAKTEYKSFDLSITTTASEQNDYFKVIFEALRRLRPELEGKFMHIAHGMMILASGKMSSRKGNIVSGESIIEDMRARAREKMYGRKLADMEGAATAIGVAAIKYAVLRQNAGKNIVFDAEKSLSFEGDSGPYLQYAHTRCVSILKKAQEAGVKNSAQVPTASASEPEKLIARFPHIVARAAQEYEPHYIAHYLTELAGAFNSWYARERIVDETSESAYKVAVVDAVRQTLKNGLWLLGCQAPEEM